MNLQEVDLSYLIKLVNFGMDKYFNKELGEYGITMSQLRILNYLHANGDLSSQKELSAHLNVSHPTVVGLLSRLEAKGLIECKTDAKDHRAKNIFLTDKERQLHDIMEQKRHDVEAYLTNGLTDEQVAQLHNLLQLVFVNLCGGQEEAEAMVDKKGNL